MRLTRSKFLLFAFLTCFICSCGDPEGDDEGDDNKGGIQGHGNDLEDENLGSGNIVLKSTTLASTSLTQTDTPSTCIKQIDVNRYEGVCLTPIDILGRAHYIDAADGSTSATIDDRARIVKAGEAGSGESEGQIVVGNDFALLDSDTINGTNELHSAYSEKPEYSLIIFEATYLQFKFYSKEKFVTMLLVTHPQPFAESSLVNESPCDLSDSQKSQSRYKEADIFSDMEFKRGDYLFCVKDAATDTCSASDYKWFDLDNDSLVSARPSNPRVNQWLVFQEASCSDEGDGRYNFDMSGIPFIASLNESFQLYGDFSHGVDSEQWPDEEGPFGNDPDPEYSSEDGFEDPYVLYYYKKSGETLIEGTNLDVTLDFDVEDMLYIDMDDDEYSSSSLEGILKTIDSGSNIGFHNKGKAEQVGYNPAEMLSGEVNATISLTGNRTRPTE